METAVCVPIPQWTRWTLRWERHKPVGLAWYSGQTSRLRVPSETSIVSGLNHWAQQDLQQYNCVVYYSYAQWAGLADPRQFVSLAPYPSIGA